LLAALAALAVPLPAAAEEEKKTVPHAPAQRNPLSEITADGGNWSSVRVPVGCFLVAPSDIRGEKMMIGQHRDLGLGIAVVGLQLSQPPNSPGEPVIVAAGGREMTRVGRLVSPGVMFVPLDADDMGLVLREVWTAGALWLTLRDTAIARGGQNAQKALEAYGHLCAAGGH
jgi:hypothetical protein